ncbi:hypothetical protein DL765_003255 [Monosporascus sp. GIB2]|nr:hypothetical protein DL765_003255 [Monosporascus sp. GIB2]
MKAFNWAGLSSLIALASLAHLTSADHGRFLALPLKRERTSGYRSDLKRQLNTSPRIAYGEESYLVSVDIGSPKQTVKLAVDVSSYETWAIGDCSSFFFGEDECKKAGIYNDSLSDTSVYIPVSYEERYLDNDDGSAYSLSYYADDLTIQGGETLKNVTFGLYDYSSTQLGVLGLGFGKGVNSNHSNIIDELVDQGHIQTRAFSLALGPLRSEEGSLILGGVDTKKFSGPLQRLPIVDPPEFGFNYHQTQYWITIDEATAHQADENVTTFPSFKAMQHSDAEHSLLPPDLVNTIAAHFGITPTEDDYHWYLVSCDYKNMTGSLDLKFGNLAVSVPYGDLIIQNDDVSPIEGGCYFSVMPRNVTDDGEIFWLGQNIMGHLYTVYDQEGRALWLAKYQDCGSEVIEITKDENSIAGINGQCEGPAEGSAEGSAESFGHRVAAPTAVWLSCMFAGLLPLL